MTRRQSWLLVALFAAAILLSVVVTLAGYGAGLTWCPDCDGT